MLMTSNTISDRRHTPRATTERRNAYRVVYPDHLGHFRPTIRLGEVELPVLDISENGIRFQRPAGGRCPTCGERLAAPVSFRDEDGHPIEGTVVRVTADSVAVQLDQGFHFRQIAVESSFLRQH